MSQLVELESCLHPATWEWFRQSFDEPTAAQRLAWPEIAAGNHALLLAPTGSGKTLAAFLIAIDRLMFGERTETPGNRAANKGRRTRNFTRVVYLSPLKALGVDVDRNLRSPLAGIRERAQRRGDPMRLPTVGIRSGDTPANERGRLQRDPPDILITTPESLYLLLTSQARETLQRVETVIIDEIHSMVANKRGAHLFASLERLERLRSAGIHALPDPPKLQRIGLSATQRPLKEVARLLGGAVANHQEDEAPTPREVKIVEAGRRKPLELMIQSPVEDMKRPELGAGDESDASWEAAASASPSGSELGPSVPSIWPALHPKLVELIRQHRSTMIFVNSRRLAERLAAAINESAGEELALAHHGSIAKDARQLIEDRLKRGALPAIVATSSLELGIDIGAVDLVIQIEAPPSIASGLQRIGRAGHQVGAQSKGIIFPKYRGDLLACSAAAERMLSGEVEETFYLRNPLDVLAQQIVAMAALEPVACDEIYATLRQAAPFHELTRHAFDGVLDLLSGRYPSDEFSELRARVNWDRTAGMVSPRKGTQRLAVLNAGAIPDRGLYGVFLADGESSSAVTGEESLNHNNSASNRRGGRRVGELDEEMVFEMRPGDVFLLGASSWRAMEITKDRVLVVPAPGEPGRMPFWRGEGPGRPLEFGRAIGQLTRRLLSLSLADAHQELEQQHALDATAAENLMAYLLEQREATQAAPDDRTLVVECFVDEIGDWRIAILSPFGARVHAPWAMAILSRFEGHDRGDVDMMWTDDGIMFRMPESESPPSLDELFPSSEDVEDMIVNQIGSTALFAARFRENAARALLLPRQFPGKRSPLWLQRRRSADLLKVAARYPSFPILLETYRECLRDVFDLRGLKQLLREVETRKVRVERVETSTPSPFAAAMMFNFMAGLLYDGDAPLAERRAASLNLDHAQLRELLGSAELRELLDQEVVAEMGLELQRMAGWPLRDADGLHDLLQFLGDLTVAEMTARCGPEESQQIAIWLEELQRSRRAIAIQVAGETRFAAAEDAARYRDALGAVLPPGLPAALLESPADPTTDLVSRFSRTHTPFVPAQIVQRLGLAPTTVKQTLSRLAEQGRVVAGEFLPGGEGTEFCDAEVLKRLKRRSLAKIREQIEPVEPRALAAFMVRWHSLDRPRRGLDGVLDAIEQLQGLPLSVSDLEGRVLPARVTGYAPADLDELCAAGELIWQGAKPLSGGDGRIGLYLADHTERLLRQPETLEDALAARVRSLLSQRGAIFFSELTRELDEFPNDILDALWSLVWNGEATNDTLAPIRSVRQQHQSKSRGRGRRAFRTRRTRLPGTEGRWSLLAVADAREGPTATERQTALAEQLLKRYGVVVREWIGSEGHPGGFAGIYPVFRMMEDAGKVRRGYFAAGLGASQFALPGVEDRLRDCQATAVPAAERDEPAVLLAACDPANIYGAVASWPEQAEGERRLTRSTGARVVIWEGELLAYLERKGIQLITFLPEVEPRRSKAVQQLARALAQDEVNPCSYLEQIDGAPAAQWDMAEALLQNGYVASTGASLRLA